MMWNHGNVNPGWINPVSGWWKLGGTIKKYWMKWLLEEYPPNFHKPWFSKIRGWHYHDVYIWYGWWILAVNFWHQDFLHYRWVNGQSIVLLVLLLPSRAKAQVSSISAFKSMCFSPCETCTKSIPALYALNHPVDPSCWLYGFAQHRPQVQRYHYPISSVCCTTLDGTKWGETNQPIFWCR